MTKNGVITQEAARAAGQAIKHVSQGLQGLAEREAMEGAMAVTFERVALLQEVSRILDQPEVEGMILFAAKAGEFEYVDTLNDAQILTGAKRAVHPATCQPSFQTLLQSCPSLPAWRPQSLLKSLVRVRSFLLPPPLPPPLLLRQGQERQYGRSSRSAESSFWGLLQPEQASSQGLQGHPSALPG